MEPLVVFFNDTATTEIYTLSLHDALPIFVSEPDDIDRPRILIVEDERIVALDLAGTLSELGYSVDRKSTRLNSSHANIAYAVFCLKKKQRWKSELNGHVVSAALALFCAAR